MSSFRNQQGQVLVFGLLLLSVLLMAWSKYYAVGQTTAAKTRLVHGLDAAVYSAAAMQARTLNLLSYLNRAQIAHQIALAHLISLGSWAQYGATQAERLGRANPPAHLIGMLFGADHGTAYLSAAQALNMQTLVKSGGDLTQAFARHESFIHDEMASLSSFLVKNMPDFRLQTIKSVMARHYPELTPDSIKPILLDDDWPKSVVLNSVDADLFNLIKRAQSLYEFLGPRNFNKKNSWVVDSRCPSRRHQLRRRGDTAMDKQGRWQATDTQSFHALRSNRWIGCYYREYVMGWAWLPATQSQKMSDIYVENPPDDFSQQDFWRWVESVDQWSLLDTSSNPLANSYAMRDAVKWPNRGLLPFFDIKNQDIQGKSGFVVSMSLAQEQGPIIHSKSSAETFFIRPESRSDNQFEQANLFHPYWQAHLTGRFLGDVGD